MTFDYIIFAGGRLPPLPFAKELLKFSKNIITVDRGAQLALKLGVKPLFHVGDGDSFSFSKLKKLKAGAILKLPPKKAVSDLEYALSQLDSKKIKLVVGSHLDFEGRCDHGFINLILLSHRKNIYFADEKMWITGLKPNKRFSFATPSRSTFSLIPTTDLKKTRLTISGATYNMSSKQFSHITQGLSNITRSKPTYVKSTRQALLFVASDITKTKIDAPQLI